jgi:AraC-like DNA-binding protein
MHPLDQNEIRSEMMASINSQLKAKLMRKVPAPGRFPTAIGGLSLTRRNDPDQTDTCFYTPSIGVIIQGQKESVIGSEKFKYGEFDCLVNGVDMPSLSRITSASPEKPLLAMSLDIDKSLAMEMAAVIPSAYGALGRHYSGVSVARVASDVLEAFARLVDLLDQPGQIPFMAPLLIKEIITRVLMGPQGGALRMIHTLGSHSNQVAEAIDWLRSNYMHPLHIDDLAKRVDMPISTFHRQFKKITSLSPLQFQKCLRLYEAQRLMLAENMDANNAGRTVGYNNIQQFNREYKRLFGNPPHRDIKQTRQG